MSWQELAGEMYKFLQELDDWEGELLLTDEAWINALPRFTEKLYDRWIELQIVRNKLRDKVRRLNQSQYPGGI